MVEKGFFLKKREINSLVSVLNELIRYHSIRLEGYRELQERFSTSVDLNNLFSEARSLSYICRDYLRRLIFIYGQEPALDRIDERAIFSVFEGNGRNEMNANMKNIIWWLERGENRLQFTYEKALQKGIVPAFMNEILALQNQKLVEQFARIRKMNLKKPDKLFCSVYWLRLQKKYPATNSYKHSQVPVLK